MRWDVVQLASRNGAADLRRGIQLGRAAKPSHLVDLGPGRTCVDGHHKYSCQSGAMPAVAASLHLNRDHRDPASASAGGDQGSSSRGPSGGSGTDAEH